jgi:RNA polymerase sigma factor (sigma-70 family)
MNGLVSQNAAAARSGNHNGSERKRQTPRQLRNDRQALESLLAVVFAVLANCFPDASKKTHDAFDDLSKILRKYVAAILTVWGIPSPTDRAADVVQDLFLRFLERDLARKYDPKIAHRRTFLFSVLRNVLRETFRKHKPNRTVPLPADLMDSAPWPDEALAMREVRDLVSAAIGRLRPKFAEAIRVQYGLEAESVPFSDLSASARNARTCRARQLLRLDLQERLDL